MLKREHNFFQDGINGEARLLDPLVCNPFFHCIYFMENNNKIWGGIVLIVHIYNGLLSFKQSSVLFLNEHPTSSF